MLFSLLTQLPLVFSASYTDYELHVNAAYSARVNVELMKVGLRGTSLFMASGDYGIGTQYAKGESSMRVDVDTACSACNFEVQNMEHIYLVLSRSNRRCLLLF